MIINRTAKNIFLVRLRGFLYICEYMAKTKEITPIQYADYIGWWPSYIQRLLRNKRYDKLPHVIKVRKYSRFWTLEVPDNLTASDFKEISVKPKK